MYKAAVFLSTFIIEETAKFQLEVSGRTTVRPSNPTTGHIPCENHNSKRAMYHDVHCSSIYNSQDMEAS